MGKVDWESALSMGLIAWGIACAVLLFQHPPSVKIIVIPIVLDSAGTIIPADPRTGASDAPRGRFSGRGI